MKGKRLSLSIGAILTCIVLGLLVSLQLKNINESNIQTTNAEADLADMQEQVMTIMRENSDLSAKNQKLSDLISSMGAELSGDNASLQAIMDEKNRAEVFAGLTDVAGKGIQITIDPGADNTVNSKTLLLLVNELRSAGALAISVNEERIVAMTEMRDTGTTDIQIVINGNSYPATSQFVIKALYNEQDINRGLKLVGSLIERLGSVSQIVVASSDDILVPKLSEDSLTNRQI